SGKASHGTVPAERLSKWMPLFCVGLAAATGTVASPLLGGLERRVYDVRLGMRRDGGWPADLALIKIDEPTLAATSRWPWPREQIGEFVENVHGLGSKTILLDVMFG